MFIINNYQKVFIIQIWMLSSLFSFSQTWHTVGTGVNNSVYSLGCYNNELYAGGWFDTAGTIRTPSIARWNSVKWDSVSSGLYGNPFAYAVYNNILYAGGDFLHASNIPNTLHIARWNGTQWLSAGSVNNDVGQIKSLVVYNNQLYAGGNITKIGNVNVNRIAKWNGSNWSSISGGITGGFMTQVYAMATLNNKLYVAGSFNYAGSQIAFNVASWDGTQWSALDTGLNEYATSMTVDTVNNKLYVAGAFNLVGGINGINVNQIAEWDGNNWYSLGQGISGGIICMSMYHGELYIGGSMIIVGSDSVTIYMAKWNGVQWQKVLGPNSTVFTLQVYKDTLYVGGAFTSPGKNIARYYSPNINTVSEIKKNEIEYLGNNIPNPFKSSTTIPYFVPEGSKGILSVTDINGKPIKTYILTEGSNKLELSLADYVNGMYFYTLNIDDGKIMRHKKMLLN